MKAEKMISTVKSEALSFTNKVEYGTVTMTDIDAYYYTVVMQLDELQEHLREHLR